VRDVADDPTSPWYLNSAMGVLGIGGFLVALNAVTSVFATPRDASAVEIAGGVFSLVLGVGGIAAAGGMNAQQAWGWLTGVIVSGLVIATGVVAVRAPSGVLAAAIWIVVGISLLAALLAPPSREMLRRPPPRRPDVADPD